MDRDITVYQCNFELYVEKAIVSIKFPCIFFLQWKTANGKKSAEGKCRPTSVNTQVTFQQTLELNTELIFDNSSKQFVKKQTMVNLNLISKARQDQSKLVGRVAIDLSMIANFDQYNQVKTYKLAYCSVDGEIMLAAVLKNKRKTNINAQGLDKSQLNEYLSFCSGIKRDQTKKSERENYDEQTSIGYGRKVHQNVIDFHQNNDFKLNQRHQTFFVLQSPRQNASFNLTSQIPRPSRQKSIGAQAVLNNLQTEQMIRAPNPAKEYGRLSLASKNGEGNWDHDKIQFRDEIDSNRHKIEQMQRRIMELYRNLENSKRHIEFAERQNREKEEIIKKLKKSNEDEAKQPQLLNDWKEKYQILQKESSEQSRKYKISQEVLKRQLQKNQLDFQNLRNQTQELRKIWTEKRQHYDQKLRRLEQLVREKQNKINELCVKNQQLTKFKYQNDLIKVLSEEKESKIKLMQRDFVKLSQEINEIKRQNLAQQNYKLRLQNSQYLKTIQTLTKQYQKGQIEIQKYRQNYIKIQTAYQIQTKTYESTKQKYNTLQNSIFGFQKENIQLKNSVANEKKIIQEIQKKYLEIFSNYNKTQEKLQLASLDIEKLKTDIQNSRRENNQLVSLVEKHKIEDEVRKEDFEKQLKRMEFTCATSLQNKEKVLNSQRKSYELTITQLKDLIKAKQIEEVNRCQQYQAQFSKFTQQIQLAREQTRENLNRIRNLQETILDKQQIIKLSKQEIESLKRANKDLYENLFKMRQTEKQLHENIAILQEQSQKIIYILEQKQETDRQIEMIRQNIKEAENQQSQANLKIEELEQLNRHLNQKHQEILKNYQEIEYQKNLREEEVRNLNDKIDEITSQNGSMREQWLESKAQIDKLRQIIKQINERYEQHIKNQERYEQEMQNIRQQKEQTEIIMNKNSNQLVFHNQQLQNKIMELQNQIYKYESCVSIHEQQKKGLQSAIQEHHQEHTQQTNKQELLYKRAQLLERQIIQYQRIKCDYDTQIQTLHSSLKLLEDKLIDQQSKTQFVSRTIEQKDIEIARLLLHCKDNQTRIEQKLHQISRLQGKNYQLQSQIANLIENKANSPFTLNEVKEPQPKPIFQGQQRGSQRQQEIQLLLFQSDRKNQALQLKLAALAAQLQQVSKRQICQDTQQIYQSFNQFQREQMTKIIEQQRIEIDRIERQLKQGPSVDPSALQKRIQELQNHIVQLQSSFKLELDRILGQQLQREAANSGGLTVITEENSQDDIYKSQRSLVGSPSRVKSSLQMIQMFQIREKLQLLQQEKQHLQQEFNIVQQEKFNYLSTINQKDIELEQINHIKLILQAQNSELRNQLQKSIQKCKYLQSQTQSLKNQLTFGSTLNYNVNENSITRSQPILAYQNQTFENTNLQVENLKAQIERYKNREQELLWNMKDLEMQLQTVTENLNILNGSSMNSVLNSNSGNKIQIDQEKQAENKIQGQQGYSKQKLLQQLKKNEELKELSHNLIRVLKQRQNKLKEQEKAIKDMPTARLQNEGFDVINNKINRLLTQFQTIKLYVMRGQSGKLEEEATRMLGQMKNVEIMKNILIFQEQLRSVQCLSQKSLKS